MNNKFSIPTTFWTETIFDFGKYGKYKTLQVEPLPEIKTKELIVKKPYFFPISKETII